MEFSTNNIKNIELKITNLIGEIIFEDNLKEFNGEYKQKINLGYYSKGVYLFKMNTEYGVVNRKLILQ